jgi:hypothetical protein
MYEIGLKMRTPSNTERIFNTPERSLAYSFEHLESLQLGIIGRNESAWKYVILRLDMAEELEMNEDVSSVKERR